MDLIIDQNLSKRLIVLVTDCLTSNYDLAHRVHWIAERECLSVLYLVLVDDDENRLAVSRSMATMKAVTTADNLPVEVKITETGYLRNTLSEIACSGDVILCQEEQTIASNLFKTIPMKDYLAGHFDFPVRAISGYYLPPRTNAKKWYQELFSMFVFLAILVVFTWLQINLDRLLDGSLQKIFIIAAFCIEVFAVWAWYKFSYQ